MEQPQMNTQELIDTAKMLVAGDKGLLAMDESNPTCNKRFASLGIPQTEEARRAYRELIITTPGLGESISGAILFDETIHQQKKDGTPFDMTVLNDLDRFHLVMDTIDRVPSTGEKGEALKEQLKTKLAEHQRYICALVIFFSCFILSTILSWPVESSQ